VLPFLQAYVLSGEFTVKDKLKAALKTQCISYAIMAVCGLVFFLYLKVTNRVGEYSIVYYLF